MRWVKAALIGLVSGVLLTAAVLAVQVIDAHRVTAAQIEDCEAALNGGGGVCFGSAQVGGKGLAAASVVGFAFAFGWFLLRAPRRPAQ
jgi:hypothetical protein